MALKIHIFEQYIKTTQLKDATEQEVSLINPNA